MVCSNCSATIDNNSRFCNLCGQKINNNFNQTEIDNVKNENQIDLQDLIKNCNYNKIQAIKSFYDMAGLDLASSKEIIEMAFKGLKTYSFPKNQQGLAPNINKQIQYTPNIRTTERMPCCPNCHSSECKVITDDFSYRGGIFGAIESLFSSRKPKNMCLKCGHKWKN